MSGCEQSSFSAHQNLLELCKKINHSSPIKHSEEFYHMDLQKIKSHAKNVQELRPSGPRPGSVGTKQEEQGIVYSGVMKEGGVVIAATLLAAGFVVGSQGCSIKQICESSGVVSKSWFSNEFPLKNKPWLRVFYMEGCVHNLIQALRIIVAAVNRYRELVNGKFKDQVVGVKQLVEGIYFEYKPPPIHTMPEAARTIEFQGAKPSDYGKQKAAERERFEAQVQMKEKSAKEQWVHQYNIKLIKAKMMQHKYIQNQIYNRQQVDAYNGIAKGQFPSNFNTSQHAGYNNCSTTTAPQLYSYPYPYYMYYNHNNIQQYSQYPANTHTPMQFPSHYQYPQVIPSQTFGHNTAPEYVTQFQPCYVSPTVYAKS